MIKFCFLGKPIAKTRHRTFIQGKFLRTFDNQTKEKEKIKAQIVSEMRRRKDVILDAYLDVRIDFYFPVAESLSNIRKNQCLWFHFPTVSDLDNLAKFYLDCCNSIAFNDDRQIVTLNCRKFYSHNPRTEITIMPRSKNVEEEVSTILGLYGTDELCSFIEIAWQLGELYHVDDNEDWVKEELQNSDDEEVRIVRLTRTAYLLSKFAYNHANLLKTIERKCPGFWQKAERIAKMETENDKK